MCLHFVVRYLNKTKAHLNQSNGNVVVGWLTLSTEGRLRITMEISDDAAYSWPDRSELIAGSRMLAYLAASRRLENGIDRRAPKVACQTSEVSGDVPASAHDCACHATI